MTRKVFYIILPSFFLFGCFAESMTLVQSGVNVSQGRIIQSTVTPALSLGVKQTTGKYPVEHIIIREKQRMAKKALKLEKKVMDVAKQKINFSKEKILPIKNNIENQVTKLNKSLVNFTTIAIDNFKHKPRFSYKVR